MEEEEVAVAAGGALPPQEPLRAWVRRGRALASQTGLLLQQLLWLLHCCPEDLQNTETPGLGPPTPRCLTPLADHRQPAGCLMRRGDAAWLKARRAVEQMLEETQGLGAELDGVEKETVPGTLHSW